MPFLNRKFTNNIWFVLNNVSESNDQKNLLVIKIGLSSIHLVRLHVFRNATTILCAYLENKCKKKQKINTKKQKINTN